jgi:transcription termination factor NusB
MSKPSIEEIKQNLCIFKNAVNKTRNDLDKVFERSINGLENSYKYRKIVENHINKYKKLQKDIGLYIGTDKWDKYINEIDEEKKQLDKVLKAYIKVRDVEALEITNNAILAESDAREFMLACMSDLIGSLIELNGDRSDDIIIEAESIIKTENNNL